MCFLNLSDFTDEKKNDVQFENCLNLNEKNKIEKRFHQFLRNHSKCKIMKLIDEFHYSKLCKNESGSEHDLKKIVTHAQIG